MGVSCLCYLNAFDLSLSKGSSAYGGMNDWSSEHGGGNGQQCIMKGFKGLYGCEFRWNNIIKVLGNFVSQILLLLLLKPAAQTQVGKTELFINCLCNPTSTCATENSRKHHSGKQPTVDCTLEPIQRSGVKKCTECHSTFEPGPAGNTLKIGTFYIFDTSISNG